MKKIIYGFLVTIICWTACESDSTPLTGKTYLEGSWQVSQQTVTFNQDSLVKILTPTKNGQIDTMMGFYTFSPDSTPAQLDFYIYEGYMEGARLFGIIDQFHQDSFRFVSERGFEGRSAEYRPKSFETERTQTYVRLQD